MIAGKCKDQYSEDGSREFPPSKNNYRNLPKKFSWGLSENLPKRDSINPSWKTEELKTTN